MSNRRTRRRPPQPRAAALPPVPPPAEDIRPLRGWTVETFAEIAGIDRIEALRQLTAARKRGEVVEMRVGERILWARLGGGAVTEVAG